MPPNNGGGDRDLSGWAGAAMRGYGLGVSLNVWRSRKSRKEWFV
ncbi:MAG: hypothetical protein QXR14_03970 [Sulfolobales archaeon]